MKIDGDKNVDLFQEDNASERAARVSEETESVSETADRAHEEALHDNTSSVGGACEEVDHAHGAHGDTESTHKKASRGALFDVDSETNDKELPDGIIRVGSDALASERLLTPYLRSACASFGKNDLSIDKDDSSSDRVQLAVFDFDGTSIVGSSPVALVRQLGLNGKLHASVLLRILLWGLAYKFRLPQNEAWVRGLVFSAFRGKPVCKVNAVLWRFYTEYIEKRFRKPIDELMEEHVRNGHIVMCISATFEPFIAEAMLNHPIHFGIATRMHIDDRDCYTDQVEGTPVEGDEKTAVLTKFADDLFGVGRWELGWAYGDHHSDEPLLAASKNGVAVMPDRPLAKVAAEKSYEILSWDDKDST